jgi:hypothetical protein
MIFMDLNLCLKNTLWTKYLTLVIPYADILNNYNIKICNENPSCLKKSLIKNFYLIADNNNTLYVYIARVICKWTTNLWIMLLINKRDQLCSVKFW